MRLHEILQQYLFSDFKNYTDLSYDLLNNYT